MSDALFVLGAYGIVLTGIAIYSFALARRVAAARRVADEIERAREHDAAIQVDRPAGGDIAPGLGA